MRRKPRFLILLLLAFSLLPVVLGQGTTPAERDPTFALRHGDPNLDNFPFVPVSDARYESFRVVRLTAEGELATDFSGPVKVRGLTGQNGEPITSVQFDAGVARVGGASIEHPVLVQDAGGSWKSITDRGLPGYLSLLPPLAAIVLAVVLREVLLALIIGIASGVMLLDGNLFKGLLSTVDRHVVHALANDSHVKIIIFSCLLGGVVAMVSRLGGVRAIVEGLGRRGRTGFGAQLSTWFMGIFIFFDDYANALLVGNTMRPISDRMRVSREKLAFLVDCTAAPVACIAIISTWIATEISYISGWLADATRTEGIAGYTATGAYQMFLDSVPYTFYPILALTFALLIVLMRRDFGPMHAAEVRARTTGKVLADGARPLTSSEMDAAEPVDPKRLHWWNGALPILTVILTVVIGLYVDGRPGYERDLSAARTAVTTLEGSGVSGAELVRARETLAGLETSSFFGELRQAFGRADSYNVLLWASVLGLLVAWVLGLSQRLLTIRDAADTTVGGIKSMIIACMVLLLAWTLSDLCSILNTSGYLIQQVPFDFNLLPAAVFLLAAVVGFSTGSSWGTMGILVPLTLTYAAQLGLEAQAPLDELRSVLLGSLGAVLAGAVFGDHCSPISDTTVMSSMAAGSDHLDHVRTQLPYAAVVAAIALVTGYIPAGFGVHPGICLLMGLTLVILSIRFLGRTLPEAGSP